MTISGRKSEQRNILIVKLFLFLLFPVIPVLWSIADMRRRSSYIILFLYALLIGFCFTLNESTDYDSLRYVEEFENIETTFYIDFARWITLSSNVRDFYLNTLSFVVSFFTSNYHYLFLSAAFIFSLLCLSTLKYLTNDEKYNANMISFFILLLFFISNSIININAFRFWTAAWYVVWCSFNLILKERKYFWVLLLLSPFFHSSMFVYFCVMLLYRLTRKAGNFWEVLSVLSVFVSSFSVLIFQSIESYLPEALQSTIGYYTDKDYVALRSTGSGWYWVEVFFKEVIKVYFVVALLVINRNSKRVPLSISQRHLLTFTFCILTFSNFTSSIPSLGDRFIHIVYPFVCFFLLKYSNIKQVRSLILLIPFILSFSMVYTFVKMYIPLLPSSFFYSSPVSLVLQFV
jgi:hypothetical protein